jgi:polyisoprenyl-phosphate glycosyltransferase
VSTLTLAFLASGYSIKYVPIDYRKRAGRSKFHWWRDTQRYLIQVIRMILSFNPLRVFLPLGVMLTLLGLGKLGYDFATKDFRVATNTLLIFFAAFQVISIGLLADLVVRVNKPTDEVEPASL